jgi:hypothetical protein
MKRCGMSWSEVCGSWLVLFASMTGCAGKIYPHDQALEDQLKGAQKSLEEASAGDADAFATMTANLEKAAELRRAAIVRSAENKRNADLNGLADAKWNELKNAGKEARASYAAKLEGTKAQIKKGLEEIARLQQLIESNPAAELEKAPAAETAELTTVTTALTSATSAEQIKKYLTAAGEFLNVVDEKAFPALEKFANDQKLDDLVSVLRKAKDEDLIGQVHEIIQGVKEPESVALPPPLKEAFTEYLGLEVATVGQLRTVLAQKDTAIQEVRLSLLREGRRTMAELRKAQLADLKERLRLYNVRLLILQQLVTAAGKVEAQSPGTDAGVLAALESQYKSYRDSQAGDARTQSRQQFSSAIRLLSFYIQMNGSLERSLRLTDDEIQTLEHRALLANGRIGTEAYRRLAALGLDGMVAFAEGGVTEEQIANWLRALEAAGVGVIGIKVD